MTVFKKRTLLQIALVAAAFAGTNILLSLRGVQDNFEADVHILNDRFDLNLTTTNNHSSQQQAQAVVEEKMFVQWIEDFPNLSVVQPRSLRILKEDHDPNKVEDQVEHLVSNTVKAKKGSADGSNAQKPLGDSTERSDNSLGEQQSFFGATAQTTTSMVAASRHPRAPKARAPWDPTGTGSGRGHKAIQEHCDQDLNATGCRDVLPLDLCLRTRLKMRKIKPSESCGFVLDPCKKTRDSNECRESRIYRNRLDDAETKQLENILALIDQAASMGFFDANATSDDGNGNNNGRHQPLDYWMAAGSMIGGLAHHARIPWDDDVDVYVRKEHMDALIENIESLGLSVDWLGFAGIEKRTFKVYNASLTKIRGHDHTYPFVDFFPVDCSNGVHCIEYNSKEKHSSPINSTFPLKRRPFGRLSMLFPAKTREIVENRYGIDFKKNCKKGAYNHRRERFTGRENYHGTKCSDMSQPPPLVVDRFDLDLTTKNNHSSQQQAQAVVEEKMFVPWIEDFPDLSVEYILNDNGERLTSVVYDDGNEIRRSYADGLLQVDGNAVTYTIPSSVPNHKQKLVPFLAEERLSFLSNTAGRSAKDINLEVLPVLDRVVISNKFVEVPLRNELGSSGNNNTSSSENNSGKKVLRVGEWNAARGLDWDVFPKFYPNADIIILNEMDLGMARSGNQDTTKAMADSLRLNYAYGVEFLELTNGNEQEINATVGKSNLIGYHGNVVLTKFPIVESKTVRLHPLYDLLYEEKTSGMAKGERRLGGRMALFTLIRTSASEVGGGDILVVSIHAHAGSKPHLLERDARLVCDEIQKYNSTPNVIIGGDIDRPIPQKLVSDCGFLPLKKTNSVRGNNDKLVPSWRIVCPDGNKPKTARYPTRGDYILAKGPGFDADSDSTITNTIYPYRKHEGSNRYECVSDHAILTWDVPITT